MLWQLVFLWIATYIIQLQVEKLEQKRMFYNKSYYRNNNFLQAFEKIGILIQMYWRSNKQGP